MALALSAAAAVGISAGQPIPENTHNDSPEFSRRNDDSNPQQQKTIGGK
jgi:hypothetical protein